MSGTLIATIVVWLVIGTIVVLRTEARLLGIPVKTLGKTPAENGIFLKRSSGALAWILLWPAVPYLARRVQRP